MEVDEGTVVVVVVVVVEVVEVMLVADTALVELTDDVTICGWDRRSYQKRLIKCFASD